MTKPSLIRVNITYQETLESKSLINLKIQLLLQKMTNNRIANFILCFIILYLVHVPKLRRRQLTSKNRNEHFQTFFSLIINTLDNKFKLSMNTLKKQQSKTRRQFNLLSDFHHKYSQNVFHFQHPCLKLIPRFQYQQIIIEW